MITAVSFDPGVKGRWVVMDIDLDEMWAEHLFTNAFQPAQTPGHIDAQHLDKAITNLRRELTSTGRRNVLCFIEEIQISNLKSVVSTTKVIRQTGMIEQCVGKHFGKIYRVPPIYWKKYFNLVGKPKKASIQTVKEVLGFRPKTPDEADAMLMPFAHLDFYSQNKTPSPDKEVFLVRDYKGFKPSRLKIRKT